MQQLMGDRADDRLGAFFRPDDVTAFFLAVQTFVDRHRARRVIGLTKKVFHATAAFHEIFPSLRLRGFVEQLTTAHRAVRPSLWHSFRHAKSISPYLIKFLSGQKIL